MKKFLLSFLLFCLGLIGIVSMLTMEIPLPKELTDLLENSMTHEQMKLLILINPTIMLVFSVILGSLFYKKAEFKIPLLEKLLRINDSETDWKSFLKTSLIGGGITGILLSISGLIATSFFTQEMDTLSNAVVPSVWSRLLYGGLTEEILMRFGLMTITVSIIRGITKKANTSIYWTGIMLATLLFAIGHLPVVFSSLPEPSIGLLTYVIIGNSIGGIIFGWLYWKKGLESAFIAHMIAHVVMMLVESLFLRN